ncbi:MAG TPA: thioredoxin-disulfide reductase [Gaiellaceae bacterium]|nr:thioredoxin-disulfide reductase [Gaiellaceae bacterium]
MTDVRDVIIIGGGPAGYTAALYAARANLRPLVIEGFQWGGQLMITSDVENYPGYADGVLGPEMMQDFRRQAERFGTEFLTDDVTRVDLSERPFRVYVGDDEYQARSVIVATGASARQLGLESERALHGRGVTYCATCDAAFYRDREVVVVGGGDSAMEEALFLTKFASKVTLVHRRDEFRASQIMVDRARAHEKIVFMTPYVVEEVLGVDAGKLDGVRLRNLETGETEDYATDGLFVAIGHDPNTALFLDWLDHDDAGYLITRGKSTETNVPGVFAAGDVQDHVYRQAVTAAGSGCQAALDAERFLAAEEGHLATALTAPRPEVETV